MGNEIVNRIITATEIWLVKWGFPLFVLGIICYWLPVKGLFIVTLISLFVAVWLLLLLSIRFAAHAFSCFEQRQPEKAMMFLVVALPGIALFVWSAIAQGHNWYVPASWQSETTTFALSYMALLTIGVRWWYVSGDALAIRASKSVEVLTQEVKNEQ